MKKNKLYQACAASLFGGFLLPSATVIAQDEQTADKNIEKIAVTGTRIRAVNLDTPSPITTLDSEAIQYSGKTSVQEVVAEIGALVGSEGESEVSNGENALILRNLGAARTLVLVDGQRFVSGFGGTSAVDTNNIPVALIERVDVFTGGASAIYGADAVTGVVNFVLKDNFEGVQLDAHYSDAQDGDFEDQQLSLTLGQNFDNERGNVTFSYIYGHRPWTPATARAQSSTDVHEQVNNINGDKPEFVLMSGTKESFFTETGARFDPFGMFSGGFNGDGTPFVHGQNVGSFAGTGEIGGDGIPNWMLFAQGIRPENTRHVFTFKSHYEVNDHFQPYANLNYSKVETTSFDQESLTVGMQVARDNAFLPTAVLDAANAANWAGPLFFNRWDLDGGYLNTGVDKTTYRVIIGAKGEINDTMTYDISLNSGKTKRDATVHNNRFFDRYIAAMDAVTDSSGKVVCRSNLDPASFNTLAGDFLATSFDASKGAVTFTPGANSGCVAFNPFIQDRQTNQAAIDWIWQPTTNQTTIKQTVLSGYINGDSSPWFELPAGAVDFVLGAEYRKEESSVVYDQYSGSDRTVAFSAGVDLAGEFSVKEVFAEVSVPLLYDQGFMLENLTLDGAYRLSDYSTIGKTSAWKLGLFWDWGNGIALRSTMSKAVRAPNIGELFEPRTNISRSLRDDPCDKDNLDLGSATRRANCAAALNALGVDPNTFDPLLGTFFPAITGGNPDLKEETATTKTIGAVWQPEFAQGLALSVDYFAIDLEDAVIKPGIAAIFNACYDSPTLDNVFCGLIGRDPTTGAANFVELEAVNVAKIETAGYEIALNYSLPTTTAGDFKFAWNGTYLDKLDIQKSALPIMTDEKGLFNTDTGGASPEWVWNLDVTWQYQQWDINYGYNYSSKTLRPPLINAQRAEAHDYIDSPYVKAFKNHDIQVGYSPNDELRVYAGIRNLTDEYPDKVRGSLNGPSGRQGFAGRTWYLGLSWRLDSLMQ